MKSVLRNHRFRHIARISLAACVLLIAGIAGLSNGKDRAGFLTQLTMAVGMVSVSALATQQGDKKRERATLLDRNKQLWNDEQTQCAELKTALAIAEPDDPTKAKITDLQAKLKATRDEFAANEQKIAALSTEIDELGEQIRKGDSLNTMETNFSRPDERHVPHDSGAQTHTSGTRIEHVSATPQQRARMFKHDMGTLIRAAGVSSCNPLLAAQYIANWAKPETGLENQMRDSAVRVADALQGVNFASAGFLIPPSYVPQLIELLRPKAIIRRMGPRMPGLINGQWTQPKLTTGTAAGYVGEGEPLPLTNLQGGQLNLTAKTLAAKIPISKNVIRYGSPGALEMVTDDLIRAVAQAEDAAFIRNQGTGASPKGLRYWAVSGNVIASNVTINLDNVRHDLGKMQLALQQANIAMTNCHWGMAWRTYNYLANLQTTTGALAFPTLQLSAQPSDDAPLGTLYGRPVHCTTQIPVNLGDTVNQSEIYFVDADDLLLAEDPMFELSMADQATYTGSDGNLRSAWENEEVLVKVVEKHDFGPRHAECIAVLTGVKWGAS